jgi:hypothetical protein
MNDDGITFHRRGGAERLAGLVYYASVSDENIRRHNLELLSQLGCPCWPNPESTLGMDDRHWVMMWCIEAGLTTNDVFVGTRDVFDPNVMPDRFVLKVGNEHRGEGKLLVDKRSQEIPAWDGLATAEPFFEGTSYRVLLIDNETIFLRFDNPDSWIRNGVGGDVTQVSEPSRGMITHAKKVRDLFSSEICGIDYVVEADGTFRFLEHNQFPGVGSCDASISAAKKFFRGKMDLVERACT